MKTNMLIIFFILSCIFSSLAQATPIQNQVTHIASGANHSLAIKEDGSVWAWGQNNYNQLGDGSGNHQNTPVKVDGLSNVSMIAAGQYHSLSLKNDGSVWAWGCNTNGQLGDGTTVNRTKPVQVSNLSQVTMIASGRYHNLAMKDDGSVWAWGVNSNGQLGDETNTNKNIPVQISDLSNVIMIASGAYHSLAIKNDGSVWAWGYNGHGELGDGTTTKKNIPVQVSGLSNITMIAAGEYHNLAIKNDGSVWGWGYNEFGQLGNGITSITSGVVQVSEISNVTMIAAGAHHSLSIKNDGSLWAWGYNQKGELGDGTTENKSRPVQLHRLSRIIMIAAGDYYSLALKDNSSIWSWGRNNYGQLGYGTTEKNSNPVQVTGLSNITMIAAGANHSLAIKENGSLWAWGANNYGQLGDETTFNKSSPMQIAGNFYATMIAVGYNHSIVMSSDGLVWAWGYNGHGELGDSTNINKSKPVQVQGLSQVTMVAAGSSHTLALKNNGSVWAWGYNPYGQLGDGTSVSKDTPVLVSGVSDVTMIVAGTYYSLALKNDGSVWTWGCNSNGELGDGTTTNRKSPVQLTSLSHITMIAAGSNHSLAIKNDGTVWAWGCNNHGQLGDETTTNRNSPVQVYGLSHVTMVAAGLRHSLAIKDDGSLWTWGNNTQGELGDGTTISIKSPKQVSGLSNITIIASKINHSLAIKDDGTLWSWGNNEYGQLGYGYPTYLPEPVYSEIQFSQKTFTTSQNTTIMIPVINTAQKNTTFSFTTIDNTAIAGVDYLYKSGYLTFQANERQKNIPITTLISSSNQTEKSFILNIGAPDDIFLNDTSQAIITISSRYAVNYPYSQTFTQNLPANGWTYHSGTYGRIQQTVGCLRMDSNQDDTESLNEAILHIDLSSVDDVNLNFFQKSIANDICTQLPPIHKNHFNGDGLSLSTDGKTWYRIMDSNDLMTDSLGKNYSFNLSATASAIKANHDENFHLNQYVQIKFQQYGNRSYPSGGREWDNISVTGTPKSTIQFQQTTHMIDDDGNTYIPVMRTGNIDITASVDYATQDGTAIAGQDFPETTGQIIFEPGETVKYIKLLILADIFRNQDLYFQVILSNPSDGYSLGDIHTCLISISCHKHLSQSYEQSFDHFLPASGWQYYSSDTHGRIQIENNALRMDAVNTTLPILNEAELHMDLAWADQVHLSFLKKSYETADPIPDMFTDHVNGDGVSISMDGVTWYAIVQASEMDDPYTSLSVHFNQKIAEINQNFENIDLGFCNDFRIRFQQYNQQEGMLGRDWDNINVQLTGSILELDTDIIAMPDDPFTIPLELNNPNKQPTRGIYVVLNFDSEVMHPLSASLENGFLSPENYQVDISTVVPNELLISIYCTTNMYSYSSGTAAFLTFKAGSTRFDNTAIAFEVAEINESPVNAKDGHFMVKNDQPFVSLYLKDANCFYMDEDMSYSGITVTVADTETPAEYLNLTVCSHDTDLFPVDSDHFQFLGNQTIRTLNVRPALHQSGFAMIDLVVADEKGLTQTTFLFLGVNPVPDPPLLTVDTTACGIEDTPLTLNMQVNLQDIDGSESLSDIMITNVPEGAFFSSGSQIQTNTWQFQKSELQHLTFTPPLNDADDLTLYLSAMSTETSTGQSATATQTIHVTVLAQADPPIYTIPHTIYGNSDVYFPMNMVALRTDVDGSETLNLIVSNMPTGSKLSAGTDNGDGTWTVAENDIAELQFIPPHQDDSDFTLTITLLVTETNDNSTWRKDFTMNVVVTGYRISGNVLYYANDLPVRNVLMELSGDLTYTAVTDDNGQYVIPAVSPGYYKLSPSKNDDLLGVSQTDASDISRYIIHAHDLTCTTLIAADVSLNRFISPQDVSDISIYAIPGLLKECINDICQAWTFSSIRPSSCGDQVAQSTPYRQYIFLDGDQYSQDFIAFRLGDVTGNWQPDDAPSQSSTTETRYSARILKTEIAQESNPFTVAIAIDDSLDIRGIDIGISFDPDTIQPTTAHLIGTILENENYEFNYGTGIPGEITVGMYARNDILTGSGEIVYIQFNFIGNETARSPLTFTRFLINEQPTDGGFILENHLSPHVEVALNNGVPILYDTEPSGPRPIGFIPDQFTFEDTAIHSIALTTLSGCHTDLYFYSSDTRLIAPEFISYTCMSDTFYISLTPATDQSGNVMITISVIDENNMTLSTSFDVSVCSINDPPVVFDAEFFTTENQEITGVLDSFDKDGMILSYTIVAYPLKGTVSVNNVGDFTYNPTLNQYGEDFFEYVAYDDIDARSNTARVNIFITPINSPPFAYSKDITVDEDKYIYIKLLAADPDNDNLIYHLIDLPAHGNISQQNDVVVYTPAVNYNGPDRFTYKVNDGLQDSNVATVMITVYPALPPIHANTQHVYATENMPINITLTGYSPYNEHLTFKVTEQPIHGILSQSTPHLTYTPETHFFGTDAFQFIVNDGISDSTPETISISVMRSSHYVLKLKGNGYGIVNIHSTSVLLPWESQFQADQKICFEAVPDSDWQFINWTGDLQSTLNPVCITLNQNKAITANIAIKTLALTVQGNEPITINNERYYLPYTNLFDIHTPIILESASDRFNCWKGDIIYSCQNVYEFTINSDTTITAVFHPVPDWQAEIHVNRWVDNADVMMHNSVFLGTASQAYTKKATDLPNNYSSDIILLNNQNSAPLIKNIHLNNKNEYQWLMAVDPHGNVGTSYVQETATLSWDASLLSPEGQYVLKSNTGEIVISDMRFITEYQVSGTSYTSFTILWQRFQSHVFGLNQGWNLISLPLTPSTTDLKNLFSDYEAAYEYKNGAYYPVTTIIPGKGFWLKVPSQKEYSLYGQPFPSYTVDLSEGWHLIGGSFEKMAPEDVSIQVIYRYVNGSYEQASSLLPGWGYWIKIIE
jgi:alpha-tubulin suppressor-like RCC1 family protein